MSPLSKWSLARPADVPLRFGAIERLSFDGGTLVSIGWLHAPGETIGSFALFADGAVLAVVPPFARPDVNGRHPGVILDERLGFRAAAFLGSLPPRGWITVDVVGFAEDRPVGRTSSVFVPDPPGGLPEPPPHLRLRVANTADPDQFRTGGLRTAGELFEAIERHRGSGAPVRRLLEWGSGCGRVTCHFLPYLGGRIEEIVGCDIDAEAVEWCRRHLPAGRFVTIGPEPPTPFRDAEFDAVVGYSVMTHLDRNRQTAWLRELRRVVRPGGLVLVSVHGGAAAAYVAQDVRDALRERGIADHLDDRNLEGIAPTGYYRTTYQTRAYTEAAFGREMELLEYVEWGMGGYQDLVVMRRP